MNGIGAYSNEKIKKEEEPRKKKGRTEWCDRWEGLGGCLALRRDDRVGLVLLLLLLLRVLRVRVLLRCLRSATHTHTHTHTTQGQISNVISDQRPVQDRRTLSPQLVSRAHQNSPYFGTRAPERSTDKNRRYGCFASLIFADESTRHEKLLRAQLTRRVNVGG